MTTPQRLDAASVATREPQIALARRRRAGRTGGSPRETAGGAFRQITRRPSVTRIWSALQVAFPGFLCAAACATSRACAPRDAAIASETAKTSASPTIVPDHHWPEAHRRLRRPESCGPMATIPGTRLALSCRECQKRQGGGQRKIGRTKRYSPSWLPAIGRPVQQLPPLRDEPRGWFHAPRNGRYPRASLPRFEAILRPSVSAG